MLRSLHKVAGAATWIAGLALVICSVLVTLEVVLRKAFSYSLGGVDEITSYVFAIGTAWSLAYTVLGRAHIRIDILYTNLRPALKSLLDLVALVCLLVVSGILLQQAASTAITSFEIGAHSNTPLGIALWIPQTLWASGLAFFVLVLVVLLCSAARLALSGQHRRASEIAGIRTIEEEIRDEL